MDEIKNNNKKRLIISVIGLVVAVIAVVGATYAVWTYTFNGSSRSTIDVPGVELELLESQENIINITNALPKSYNEGKNQEETFDFAVTSKTLKDIDIDYTVTIEKLEVDTGYTSLNDNQIALYLTDENGTVLSPSNVSPPQKLNSGRCVLYKGVYYDKDGNVSDAEHYMDGCCATETSSGEVNNKMLSPKLLENMTTQNSEYEILPLATCTNPSPGTTITIDGTAPGVTLVSQLNNYVIYSGTHEHDSTHNKVQDKFKLRAWIDENVDASNWTSATKLQYKFKIGVSSNESQYPEYVFSYNTHSVLLGDSLERTTAQKYCIVGGEDPNYNSCTDLDFRFNSIQLCQTALSDSQTCQQQSLQIGVGPYEEDYRDLNKTFFLGHKIAADGTVERNDVCFIRNNTLYCLKGLESENVEYDENNPAPYYQYNYNLLLEAFGPNAIENEVCSVNSEYISCSDSNLSASADIYGYNDTSPAYGDSSMCVTNDFNVASICYE